MRSNCEQASRKRVAVSPVLHLLWNDESPCERVEVAHRAAPLLRGLGEEQVAVVAQVRTLVEMPLEGTAEETQVVTADIRLVALLDEEVLLVHDAVCRQNLHRLGPCGMHRLIFGLREREQPRQFHTVCHGEVCVLADDATLLHREQGKLALKCGGFHYISHTLRF